MATTTQAKGKKAPAKSKAGAKTDNDTPKDAKAASGGNKAEPTTTEKKKPGTDASFTGDVFHLSPNNIHIEKDANPRQTFDKERLKSMAETIKHIGILNPLTVRLKDNKYYLVGGERRLKACKIAGLDRIPVQVKKLDDAEAQYARVVENLHQEMLSPVEQARAYQSVIGQRMTLPFEEKDPVTKKTITVMRTVTMNAKLLADRLGKNHGQAKISQHLTLLDLPKPIQMAMLKAEITFAHAREICGAKGHDAQMKAYKTILKGDAPRAQDLKAAMEKDRAIAATKPDPDAKRRGRPPQVDDELPNISRQGLDTAMDRLKNAKVGSRKVKEVRTSLATLYERHENARSDEKKTFWKGAIAYAEWLAGFRESF
jgi:ParB family chromosome partitioning protein